MTTVERATELVAEILFHWVAQKPGKPLLAARTTRGPWLVPVESTGSGDYLGLSRSTGFAELSGESDQVSPGELVPYYSWTDH